MHQIGEDVKDIKSRMSDLTKQSESMSVGDNSSRLVDDNDWSRRTYGHEVEKYFVGITEAIKQLESVLTTDDISNGVISICGMRGLEKKVLLLKFTMGRPWSGASNIVLGFVYANNFNPTLFSNDY